jgi:phage gp45-like
MDLSGAVQALGDMLRRTRTRVDVMITRGVVELVNDKLKTQRVQLTILGDDPIPNIEHMQPYGLSFTPPAGAEAIALAVSGSRSHTVAICVQHPEERPKNNPPRTGGLYTEGEWRLFVDAEGVVCVGAKDSAQHIPLGDLLVQHIKALTVPTAMGPSGTPINAAAFDQVLSPHKVAPP